MKFSKFFYPFLTLLICFNIIFSSFYPVLLYAQEDESSTPYDYPTPYEYPTPFEESGNNFDQFSSQIDDTETQTSEEPQEDESSAVEPESDELLQQPFQQEPQETQTIITDDESQNEALQEYHEDIQEQNSEQEALLKDQREQESSPIQTFSQTISDIPQNLAEGWEDITQSTPVQIQEQIQPQTVDDNLNSKFDTISKEIDKEDEIAQREIDQALFAPEEERVKDLAAEVVGIKIKGDLNNFELSYEYPAEYYAQIEQERLVLEDLLAKTENLAKFLEEVKWSTITLGFYDVNKFTTESINQIQKDEERLSQLEQGRKTDPRIDAALRLTGNYFVLGQMSDEQVGELAAVIAGDYGFDAGAVSSQLLAERDYRVLSNDIANRQNSLALEAAANAAMTAVGFIPGNAPAASAGRTAARPALRALLRGGVSSLDELPQPVFVGHLQEKQILDYLGQPTVDLSRLDQEIERLTKIKAQEDAFRIFGRADEQTLAKTIDWVDFDVSSETIDRAWQQADELFGPIGDAQNLAAFEAGEISSYVGPANLRDISEELRSVHPAIRDLRYELSISGVTDEQFVNLSFAKEDLVAALIKRDLDRQQLEPALQETREVYEAVEAFVRTNGNDPNFVFDNLDQTLDINGIHLTPNRIWEAQGWREGTLGQYRPGEDLVLIGYEGRTTAEILGTCGHECSHRAQDLNGALSSFSSPAAKALDELSIREYRALTEGVTQHFSERGLELTGHRGFNRTYVSDVERVKYNLNAAIVSNKGVTREQAEAIILKTGWDGSYDELIEAAGGTGKIRQIFGGLPPEPAVVSDVVVGPSRTEIERAIAGSEVNVVSYSYSPVEQPASAAEGVIQNINNGATAIREGAVNFVGDRVEDAKNFFGGIFGGGQVKGTSDQAEPVAVDAQVFELLAKKEIIKEKLREERKVNSDYIREVLRADVLRPSFVQSGTGYSITTGEEGFSVGDIEDGKYILKIGGIKGINIKVPDVVEVKGGHILIPVAVSAGDGKVKKVSYKRKGLVNEAFAEEFTSLGRVTMTVFSDQNNNGKLDKNEQILPWAGVSATLEKAEKERIIPLLSGWNLITLPALPTKPLQASGLLKQIAEDGGYATTVSTLENGSWKSYVMRGDSNFSGDDFAIVPGKAYFVKSLKRSVLIFKGQNFQNPLTIPVSSGWNAVGFPKTPKAYKASEVLDRAKGDAASRWESGLWDSFVRQNGSEYGENFSIEHSRGYIIRVTNGGQLAI